MSLTDVKKELQKFDQKALVKLICELYKKHKSVKDFLEFYIRPEEESLLLKYKQKVFEAFYPKRGFHLKLKEARETINEFKKFEPSSYFLADLMLFYVETGVEFTNDFWRY